MFPFFVCFFFLLLYLYLKKGVPEPVSPLPNDRCLSTLFVHRFPTHLGWRLGRFTNIEPPADILGN